MNATPAFADIATVTEGTAPVGPDKVELPTVHVVVLGRGRTFADTGERWAEVCGRCDGAGSLPEYAHVFEGVCMGCNGRGLHGSTYATRSTLDAGMRRWAAKQHREAEAAAAKAAEERARAEAAYKRWADKNGDLIAWCKSLSPDSVDEYTDSRVEIEDTREQAERLYHDNEFLIRSEQLQDGPEAGRWWANIGVTVREERFGSYGRRAGALIIDVRDGHALDAKQTGLLNFVMRRAIEAQAVTRWAGKEGDMVTVTGIVKRIAVERGDHGSYRRLVIEGTGEHAGITLKASSSAKAAKALEEGDTVTVTGTVSRTGAYNGARETTVSRPKFSA